MLCGGGARLPAVAARAARAGLSGIEFGVNIPGTVGGAVRMNANAYGGELESVLEWVQIATASGLQRREPHELGLAYRRSSLADGEIVARACCVLARGGRRRRQGDARGDAAPAPRGPAAGDQDVRLDVQEPRRSRAPRAQRRACCWPRPGCNGLGVGGARFAPKHANFIENTGAATHRRRARRDGRGPPPRAGALRGRARAGGADAGRRALPVVAARHRRAGLLAERCDGEGRLGSA